MNPMQTVLPLLGVVIGAVMQYLFSRRGESQKQLQILRSQAYSDYLKAIAETAHGSDDGKFKAAEAKTRIAVFGSSEAIHALAQFEAAGPMLNNPTSNDLFLAVVAEMRKGVGEALPRDLSIILLGPA